MKILAPSKRCILKFKAVESVASPDIFVIFSPFIATLKKRLFRRNDNFSLGKKVQISQRKNTFFLQLGSEAQCFRKVTFSSPVATALKELLESVHKNTFNNVKCVSPLSPNFKALCGVEWHFFRQELFREKFLWEDSVADRQFLGLCENNPSLQKKSGRDDFCAVWNGRFQKTFFAREEKNVCTELPAAISQYRKSFFYNVQEFYKRFLGTQTWVHVKKSSWNTMRQ